MSTMNVSLPEDMKTWVESRAGTGRYSNSSDYVRDLIRKDRQRAEFFDYIQKAVDDGIVSGFSEYSREETERRLKLSKR